MTAPEFETDPMNGERDDQVADEGGTTAESTLDLVARAQAGNREALDELLVRCLPSVQRWAHGRLPLYARGTQDTDDVIQQAVYQTLKRLHLFQPRHVYALQAYLREAVVNRIHDVVRRKLRVGKPEDLPEESHAGQAPSPLEELIKQQTVDRYRQALGMLKPAERQAVVLRIELDLSFDEIAEKLGKPSAAAARMTTRRALDRLAKLLGA
jgi:RNA polymerase sigma-70 factor (ECF subfamily)